MVPVTTEIFSPGSVPDALATAFARRATPVPDGPPTKRRKLASTPQSLADLNGLSQNQEPLGYIPLARFHLYLVCAKCSLPLSTSSGRR
ncbi:hypothetical protein BDV59DRAFT_106180 [Aspergillus ambiguus]|uniref:uncharacterized protein n=1 Tax=Aspergillus ambiguus TaxID=176160 RepID=UPI003CCDEAE0